MDRFQNVAAIAAPMLRDNIDTDAILPVAYMKVVSGNFGNGLFANLRYRTDGSENPDFVLNRPEYRGARIIVAGDNFACGSSREHAVWALLDFGIRCVIAEGFGDIFCGNSFRMGLLPVVLPREQVKSLGVAVTAAAGTRNVVVDLESQTVTGPDGTVYPFQVDATHRRILLEGLDAVGITLLKADAIADFQARDRVRRPWVYNIDLDDRMPVTVAGESAR